MGKEGKSKFWQLNDEEWLREKYWEGGLSLTRIAALLGCCGGNVRRAFTSFGIPRKSPGDYRRGKEIGSKFNELNDREWLEKKYWEEGLSTSKIAMEFGCDGNTVLSALKRLNIPIRDLSSAQKMKVPKLCDREWLVEKYLEEKLSPAEISNIIDCSKSTVRQALVRGNIPLRDLKETALMRVSPLLQDKEWLYNKYCAEGKSTTDIAKLVGCSDPAVGNALKRFDIPARETKYPELYDKQWVNKKYCSEKLTMVEIAELLGCSSSRVKQALPLFNIPIRTSNAFDTDSDKQWLIQKHCVEELTCREIAKMCGRHPVTIGKALTHFNIPKLDKSGERNPNYGKKHSEKAKGKMSEASKKRWKDPDFIQRWINATHAKPNKLEMFLGKTLQKLVPKEFKYNGDFSCGISIGGLIPDFVNINGKKILIELFGEPFHSPDEKAFGKIPWKRQEFGRKAIYSQYGYKCIIFWARDLTPKNAEAFVLATLKKEGVI